MSGTLLAALAEVDGNITESLKPPSVLLGSITLEVQKWLHSPLLRQRVTQPITVKEAQYGLIIKYIDIFPLYFTGAGFRAAITEQQHYAAAAAASNMQC